MIPGKPQWAILLMDMMGGGDKITTEDENELELEMVSSTLLFLARRDAGDISIYPGRQH
jgi:hypothetical protein